MLNYILLLPFILVGTIIYGQDIDQYKWQNRLLLVLSENNSTENVKEQLSEYHICKEELIERRIILYQVLPDKYRLIKTSGNEEDWLSSNTLYNLFKTSASNIEVILIGLDGGVKLRKKSKLGCGELSAVIDQMPMRRTELRKQQK